MGATTHAAQGDNIHRIVTSSSGLAAGAHDVADEARGLARGLVDADAGLLQGFLLGLRGARGAGDDRAGVPIVLPSGAVNPAT
jgi:hypothetical protein